MTKRDIAALLCKAVSLYVFADVLTMAPVAVQALRALTQGAGVIGLEPAVLVAFQALIAAVLWTRAVSFAVRMVPEEHAGTEIPVLGNELQAVAFSAVGLFVTVQAVFRFVGIGINLYVVKQQAAFVPQAADYSAAPEFTHAAVKLGVGLWLLFGAASVVNLIGSIRRGGVDAEHHTAREAPQ